jgi:hypothetical protein
LLSQPTIIVAPCRLSSRMIAEPAAPRRRTKRTAAMSCPPTAALDQRRQHDDRGAVLIIVEDRNLQLGAEPLLDLEAARRRDVLQVDSAVHRGDRLHDLDDLVRVLGIQADRPSVDPGEPLEQGSLALHHRQCGSRTDVAQPEDG